MTQSSHIQRSVGEQALLTVRSLETVFRTEEGSIRAVDGVDFDLEDGTILGVVGESGAGKSATARSVLRLIQSPGEIVGGTVQFKDRDVLSMSETELREYRRSNTGMVFQDPTTSLNPTMAVWKQVAEAIASDETDEREDREFAVALLDRVGIPNARERASDYPHQFSGGQKQRINIAIAIASEPDLLIADEPTTALDVTIQAQILDLLEELRSTMGMSIMFITHNLGIVQELCDRVAVMYAGSIVESGPVEAVLSRPQHPYTKGLLESIPDLPDGGHRANERLDVIEGTMPDLVGSFEGCKYADRCPGATDECRTDHPPLEPVSHDREVACYRYEEIDEIEYEYDHHVRTLPWQTRRKPSEQAGPTLVVDELRKHFGTDTLLDRLFGTVAPIRAVDGIDISIEAGETVGLVGESGCGKSTAARSILRLIEPTAGTIRYRDRDVTALDAEELRETRADLQLVFQDPQSSLNPRRTVKRILTRPMQVHGIPDRESRATELLKEVGLDERHFERYPHELSGGQQQRVGIARGLAVNPDVVILDEPVSGLDVSIQAQILNLLADIQDELGLAYLFISHDLSVVSHISDKIAVMYLGEIVEFGTVEEVFSPPYHPYTEALLSSIPSTQNDDDAERIILEGDVPDPSNIPSGCRFHPRCPRKIGEVCEAEEPADHDEDDHTIHCHLMREEYRDSVDWSTAPEGGDDRDGPD